MVGVYLIVFREQRNSNISRRALNLAFTFISKHLEFLKLIRIKDHATGRFLAVINPLARVFPRHTQQSVRSIFT